MGETNEDVIEFLKGEDHNEEYLEFKKKIKEEKWGWASYNEISNFYFADKKINICFVKFLQIVDLTNKNFWPYTAFDTCPKYMCKILKHWKENPPKKEIIEDFIRQINTKIINSKHKYFNYGNVLVDIFIAVGKRNLNPYDYEDLKSMKN